MMRVSISADIRDRLVHLRRIYRPSAARVSAVFMVSPVVNVVLVVFLFFVVQSSFVLQPGVVMDLPQSAMTGGARYGSMVVSVMPGGFYYFEDQRMTIDGLDRAVARWVAKDPATPLVIEADRRVPHGALIEVYGVAVRHGVRNVVMATRPRSYAESP